MATSGLVCVFLSCADALLQSHSDGESQRSNMEREDTRSSPSTPSTPSVCSPTSTTSSVPSTGKNVCASCGLEILDRYLLKVRWDRNIGFNHSEIVCQVKQRIFSQVGSLCLFRAFHVGIIQPITCLTRAEAGEADDDAGRSWFCLDRPAVLKLKIT